MRQIRLAFRALARTPVVTAVAVLSLGLGIGANTAVFSLFDQILLRPLPVHAPDELVNLAAPHTQEGSTSCNDSGDCDAVFSYPMYLDLAREQQVFTGIAAHWLFGANVGYDGETIPVDGDEVSGNYFDVLGLHPTIGRLIAPADTATAGGAPVVVLSFDYWTTRFGQDRAIVGRTIVVNGQVLDVVGVAPSGFSGTTRSKQVDVFVPITLKGAMEPPFDGLDKRDEHWAYLFARRRPGVTMAAAESGINVPFHAIMANVELPLQKEMTGTARAQFANARVVLSDGRRGQSYIFDSAPTPLLILQAVALVVLLIACANIANLLLARAAGRAGEMAVRLSIGASRAQLVRQLLLESCLMAGLGGVAGLVLFGWTVDVLTAEMPFGAVDPAASHLSLGVLLFAAVVSMATGVLFGLFPALHASRPSLAVTLKGQAGQPAGARAAARVRTGLVVAQMALSMGLLASAGLFTKSLLNVSRVDLGVKIDHVITFRLNPQRNGYATARAQQLFQDVLARMAAVPGVQSVSAAQVPLIGDSNWSTGISVDGYTPAAGERMGTNVNEVGPGYFQTVGMPLLAGRDFTDGDVAGAPKVAVVNESFARHFHLGANPVGRRFRRGGKSTDPYDIEIVGLVRDAKYSSVRQAVPPLFFLAYRQDPRVGSLVFYAKTARDPETVLDDVHPLVASLDPNLPIQKLETMAQDIEENTSQDRRMSGLSAAFAALATALAAIGLYGVLAYTVSQRTREFGLRMALGAEPSGVQRLVLRQVLRMTLIGGLVGLALAIGTGHLMRALLFEMESTDPTVLTASACLLVLVALAAGYVPARRASRVDPMTALRYE